MDGGLTIGGAARRAGVTAKAIRFYERKRILPAPRRAANGYRLYGGDAVEMPSFIRRAGGLGLTLAEIKDIIAIRRGGRPPCRHVHRLLENKAAELDRELEDLLLLRRRIRQSLAAWGRGAATAAAVCPHIEAAGAVPARGRRAGRR